MHAFKELWRGGFMAVSVSEIPHIAGRAFFLFRFCQRRACGGRRGYVQQYLLALVSEGLWRTA